MSVTHDPFAVATQAGEQTFAYYGQVEASAEFVVLKKGIGKAPFDDAEHDVKDRRTEVTIELTPIEESGLEYVVTRSVLAESRQWSTIVWPSLKDLGLKYAGDLNGKWAKAELVKTGRTWTRNTGEIAEETTLRFLALYGSEAECIAAYHAERGGSDHDDGGASDVHSSAANGNGSGVTNGQAERETALQFLKVLVQQAKGDRGALAQSIANMPMIAKHFTVDSPEVQELVAAA
jgi:hypothetical protein